MLTEDEVYCAVELSRELMAIAGQNTFVEVVYKKSGISTKLKKLSRSG